MVISFCLYNEHDFSHLFNFFDMSWDFLVSYFYHRVAEADKESVILPLFIYNGQKAYGRMI